MGVEVLFACAGNTLECSFCLESVTVWSEMVVWGVRNPAEKVGKARVLREQL